TSNVTSRELGLGWELVGAVKVMVPENFPLRSVADPEVIGCSNCRLPFRRTSKVEFLPPMTTASEMRRSMSAGPASVARKGFRLQVHAHQNEKLEMRGLAIAAAGCRATKLRNIPARLGATLSAASGCKSRAVASR